MGKLREFDAEHRGRIAEGESQETLAAIDEGTRDADAGRTFRIDEVRKLLPQWISGSFPPKKRSTT